MRARWLVLLAWAAALAAAAVPVRELRGRLTTDTVVPRSESAAVAAALDTRFSSPFARFAVLVLSGIPAPPDSAGIMVLARVTAAVNSVPGVARTFSALDAPDAFLTNAVRGGSFVIVGLRDEGANGAEALLLRLRAATSALQLELAAEHPRLELRWSGETALNLDLRRASAADVARAERRALPLTLLLLLVVFGALVAAVIPLLAALATLGVTLALISTVALHWPVSTIAQNVAAMLGLALGIDYSLLMVSRFREGLAAGAAPLDAARLAGAREGRTVLVSAGTVAIGFAALLVVPLPEVRSIAAAGLIVALVAAAAATTLVPALLAVLGPRVNRGRLPLPASVRTWARSRDGAEPWRRWAMLVSRRPAIALLAAVVPLLVLSAEGARLRSTLPSGRWLPAGLESVQALAALETMGREGVVHALRVVLELPPGAPALSPSGWRATRSVASRLDEDPRVHTVRSLPGQLPVDQLDATVAAMIPANVLQTFVSADGLMASVEVAPHAGSSGAALVQLVHDVRAWPAEEITGVPGARVLVGGLPAVNADYQRTIRSYLPLVVALVLGTTFLVLCAAFRSVLIPLKAIVLNLLSVGAAFGVVVLVVQDGHLAGLIGLVSPLDGTFAAVPLLVFCIVFGLSMDYEVFLVSRVAEARRAGMDERAAVVDGLARTGRVITSAALLMVVVFGAFTLGDFVLMKILGLALGTAVLVDALVVRTVVAPALLVLGGRWNWWPGGGVPARLAVATGADEHEERAAATDLPSARST